jgi:hypothetical protein
MSERDVSDIQERIKEILCKDNSVMFDPRFYAYFESVTEKLNKNLETVLQNMIDMTKIGGEMIIIPSVCLIGSNDLAIPKLKEKYGFYGFLVFTNFYEKHQKFFKKNPSDQLVALQIIATASLLKKGPYRKFLDNHSCITALEIYQDVELNIKLKDQADFFENLNIFFKEYNDDRVMKVSNKDRKLRIRTAVRFSDVPMSAPYIIYKKIGDSETCEACKASAKRKIVETEH